MELTVGAVLEGKVKSITNFGAFIALPENKTGMVHISEIANAYVSDIRQHLTEGQDVKVMVINLDNGKVNLSIKRLEPKPRTPVVPISAGRAVRVVPSAPTAAISAGRTTTSSAPPPSGLPHRSPLLPPRPRISSLRI